MLECVVNVSEGRDPAVLDALGAAAGDAVLDVHVDVDHHRSVWTLVAGDDPGTERAAQRLAAAAVERLDLAAHAGAHPRLGVVDVVPWIHLEAGGGGRLRDGSIGPAVAGRDRFARWAATLGLPCFLYGPPETGPPETGPPETGPPETGAGPAGRTLPELRRRAWSELRPDTGPDRPHPTAGAVCVGARPTLVAYNLWLAGLDLAAARRVAAEIRRPGLRTLGLAVGAGVQVSCNLTDPWTVGPAAAFDAVASRVEVARAELVGLAPLAVLDAVPRRRWSELDLDPSRTIEARLGEAGLDGGRFGG